MDFRIKINRFMLEETRGLIEKVVQWAKDNGLESTPLSKAKQTLCIIEEIGEFTETSSPEEMGDVFVTVIVFCYLHDIDPVEIIETAEDASSMYESVFGMEQVFNYYAAKLAQQVRKGKRDMLQTLLINLCDNLISVGLRLGISHVYALEVAYKKISKRTLKKVGGTLVKEGDID